MRLHTYLFLGCVLVSLAMFACGSPTLESQGEDGTPPSPSVSGGTGGSDVKAMASSAEFVGGPLSDGRVGDILMKNDKIRVVIDVPDRTFASFGGTSGCKPIDVDLVRGVGEAGQDNLLSIFPMINLEWTVKFQKAEILEDDIDKYGFVRVRCTGVVQVQELITPSLVATAMKSVGFKGVYPERLKNATEPFKNDPELSQLSETVVVDYILYRGASYLEMKTTVTNKGKTPIPLPLGHWLNAGGYMEMFFPNFNFVSPYLSYNEFGNVSGAVYSTYDDTGGTETKVSYAYLYDPRPFQALDPKSEIGTMLAIQGVALSSPGQSPFRLSNDSDGIILICEDNKGTKYVDCDKNTDASIRAKIPSGDFTFSSYVGVGGGSVSSALDAAYSGLRVNYAMVSGDVLNADGSPAPYARVVFFDEGKPSTVFVSDLDGHFSGKLLKGGDWVTNKLGSGLYTVEVYKEGYLKSEGKAGTCKNPGSEGASDEVDVRDLMSISGITCRLGDTVKVKLGAIFDSETNEKIPATLMIAGIDPSPKTASYGDIKGYYLHPHGVLEILYQHPDGDYVGSDHRVENGDTIELEPGSYEFIYYRGTEYTPVAKKVTLAPGGAIFPDVALRRVVETPGYIAMDFHVHDRSSLDVPIPESFRALNAAAYGIDYFNSANHDVINPYHDVIQKEGLEDWVNAMDGEEMSPLLLGHFVLAGLEFDPTATEDGGAIDYVHDSRDPVGPGRDYNVPLEDMFKDVRANSEEALILVAHILDPKYGGYIYNNAMVTSPHLVADPLSSFGNPVNYRLNDPTGDAPYAFLENDNTAMDFDGIELAVSNYDDILGQLEEQGLPTTFNFLNIGKPIVTTIDGDGHQPFFAPTGNVRNYCRSDVDPMDGEGVYPDFSTASVQNSVLRNVKSGKCLMTNGPYMTVSLEDKTGESVSYGETLQLDGKGSATLTVRVEAPQFIEWDSIDIYINDDPKPLMDDGESEEDFHWNGVKYETTPAYSYELGDGSLSVKVKEGKRSSTVQESISFSKDSWIIVVVHGTDGVSNPAFPVVTKSLDPNASENNAENLVNSLHSRFVKDEGLLKGGVPAYAISNPIYLDVDGDTNRDGNPFEAIYEGTVPGI